MKLFARTYGYGKKDLIIIHGLFGMSDNWSSIAKRFATHFKVHLVDLRNHGRSPHSHLFNYDVLSNDIVEYINDNSIKKPILMGHSLGGKVTMKLAFSHPEILYKQIIVDISPRKYSIDFHKDLLSKINKIHLDIFTKRSEVEAALSSDVPDFRIRSFILKNLYRDVNKRFAWRFNVEVLVQKITNIKEANFLKGRCHVETIFIKGENSNYINKDDEFLIKKHFTNSHIQTIKGTGHWVHAENPEDFYSQVLNFSLR